MKVQVTFTEQLQQYLSKHGYSHVQILGCSETEEDKNTDVSDYLIVALKQNDPLINSNDSDLWIDNINSDEVLEMTTGEEGINFLIEMPQSDYEQFKRTTS